ncbi:hypothetical protein [Natranaeroarchaeum aerophilus]|uniref:hypothetical protein n=1 Tax=Natranaeroarchaeum aerophilus TaxID=2917711 RepID=UPI00336AB2E7
MRNRRLISILSDAEREAYEAVALGTTGVLEFARQTDRKPGTVSTLLRRTRRNVKLEVLDVEDVALPGEEGSA